MANLQRLHILRDLLIKYKERFYWMSYFAKSVQPDLSDRKVTAKVQSLSTGDENFPYTLLPTDSEQNWCGTLGCVAGFTISAFTKKEEFADRIRHRDLSALSAQLLGLSISEEYFLFLDQRIVYINKALVYNFETNDPNNYLINYDYPTNEDGDVSVDFELYDDSKLDDAAHAEALRRLDFIIAHYEKEQAQ